MWIISKGEKKDLKNPHLEIFYTTTVSWMSPTVWWLWLPKDRFFSPVLFGIKASFLTDPWRRQSEFSSFSWHQKLGNPRIMGREPLVSLCWMSLECLPSNKSTKFLFKSNQVPQFSSKYPQSKKDIWAPLVSQLSAFS